MVQNMDKLFVLSGIFYAVAGMLLGNVMGATMDHSQMPTHAHIMLVGWGTMAIVGLIYRAWPGMKSGVMPLIHFGLHQVGALVMVIGLYLLYGQIVPEPSIGPILGISGIIVMIATALFAFIFLTKAKA